MTSQDTLAHRYGAPAPWRRRTLLVVSGALVLAFLGWVVWTATSHARPLASSELVAFEVVDEHEATAVLQVELRDDDVQASCLLRAFAEDHTVVGELSFTPDTSGSNRVEESIRTERRATSVESIGCTAEGQSRPR